MKTLTQVISGQTNGTLQLTRKRNTLNRMMTLFVLMVSSFAAMSFQNDDTTKSGERTPGAFAIADSCCTVTITNGNQRITITRISAIKSQILINDMDVQTWVNGLEAYTFKKLNAATVVGADVEMDAEFTAAELQNRRMAALYTRSLGTFAAEADDQLHEVFMQRVAAPAFGKQLKEEFIHADASMDAQLVSDEINRQEAARFRNTVINPSEDEILDMTVNASVLKNIQPSVATDADLLMDAQFNQAGSRNFLSADVKDADRKMDEQVRK